jgi:hypothetical protein
VESIDLLDDFSKMITVSLNTAIKLKEAGWIKETVFDMSEE